MKQLTIHEEFREALKISSLKPVNAEAVRLEDDCEFMESVGLEATSTYKKMTTGSSVKRRTKEFNETIQRLTYLEGKYPNYRIITLSKVREIAAKYGLVIGMLPNYTGMIPQKNVKELKEYTRAIRPVDQRYVKDLLSVLSPNSQGGHETTYLIVAPPQHFEKDLKNIKGFMVRLPEVKGKLMNFKEAFTPAPDPIILNVLSVPTAHEVFAHIATAWDIEAEDEAVRKDVGLSSTEN